MVDMSGIINKKGVAGSFFQETLPDIKKKYVEDKKKKKKGKKRRK